MEDLLGFVYDVTTYLLINPAFIWLIAAVLASSMVAIILKLIRGR